MIKEQGKKIKTGHMKEQIKFNQELIISWKIEETIIYWLRDNQIPAVCCTRTFYQKHSQETIQAYKYLYRELLLNEYHKVCQLFISTNRHLRV